MTRHADNPSREAPGEASLRRFAKPHSTVDPPSESRSRDRERRYPRSGAGPTQVGDPRVRVYTPPELNGRPVTWVTPTFFFGATRPAQASEQASKRSTGGRS